MWNKKISLLFITLLFFSVIKADDKLILKSIPDSLTKNAYSVVRLYDQEYTYISNVSGKLKGTLIVTVLNPKGKSSAYFNCSCDLFSSLKKFHGEVYNSRGMLIRKIKQSELKYSEYFEGLASDNKDYSYEYDPAEYPFTIKYEWEKKYQKGIIGLPTFIPCISMYQSVEKATFRLRTETDVDFMFKGVNMSVKPEEKSDKEGAYKEWSINNLAAQEVEQYTEPWFYSIPKLYIVPRYFNFDDTSGEMSNWNSFGQWQYSLLADRDILPESTKQKLADLTRSCKTDREKVKAIYDYLAKTTRYVSIQLGIGGLQPAKAEEVAKMGFSDCKGLSNYTKAMLKEVGIPSNYTIISTHYKKILADFASCNQMNHAILQVPLPNDTIWLECTSPELPFGYVHKDIAGNNAVVITDKGGVFCTLPSYLDEKNKEINKATIVINENGSAEGHVQRNSRLMQYESLFGFTKLAPNKQIDFIREGINLPQVNISKVSFTEIKLAEPSILINYTFTCDNFGIKTGNRLFIPVNSFRETTSKSTNKKRIHPLYLEYGYLDSDTITVEIPSNYVVESLPSFKSIKCNFGKLETKIIQEGNKIHIMDELLINHGKYEASLYPDYLAFRNEIYKAYNNQIILKKK